MRFSYVPLVSSNTKLELLQDRIGIGSLYMLLRMWKLHFPEGNYL